ncbi:Osmotin, thaumatin-like protein [Hysterangium stoloniferum]|nr:Osmotin, thaumatin-like protein [Hysterangium stoloniferum]
MPFHNLAGGKYLEVCPVDVVYAQGQVYTDPSSPSKPSGPTGWEASPGSSRSLSVPDDWTSGRIWGRTDCDASGNCASGSCAGGIECDLKVGTGTTPASLAEWTLSAGAIDFYDVSLVDGYNLPMSITNNVGCSSASCNTDLLPGCPSELMVKDASGTVVGCKSSCDWDGDTANSPSCCTGAHGTPGMCPPSGVQFYSFFKTGCPNSYVYAYDESSGTALWTCPKSKNADYTLTFCPDGTSNTVLNGTDGAVRPSTSSSSESLPSASAASDVIGMKLPKAPAPELVPSMPASPPLSMTVHSPTASLTPSSSRRCANKQRRRQASSPSVLHRHRALGRSHGNHGL